MPRDRDCAALRSGHGCREVLRLHADQWLRQRLRRRPVVEERAPRRIGNPGRMDLGERQRNRRWLDRAEWSCGFPTVDSDELFLTRREAAPPAALPVPRGAISLPWQVTIDTVANSAAAFPSSRPAASAQGRGAVAMYRRGASVSGALVSTARSWGSGHLGRSDRRHRRPANRQRVVATRSRRRPCSPSATRGSMGSAAS